MKTDSMKNSAIKISIYLLVMAFNGFCYGKMNFDFKIHKNVSAIVIYAIYYDSTQHIGYLGASNIIFKNDYFPLAKNSYLKPCPATDNAAFNLKYEKLLKKMAKYNLRDIMMTSLFADSVHKLNEYYFDYLQGGALYSRAGETFDAKKRVFYISFQLKGDLLFVWEDISVPFSMYRWACYSSYDKCKGVSSPTAFILDYSTCSKLSDIQKQMLGFEIMPKTGYDFSECY